jgi:hypothetical protein
MTSALIADDDSSGQLRPDLMPWPTAEERQGATTPCAADFCDSRLTPHLRTFRSLSRMSLRPHAEIHPSIKPSARGLDFGG